MPLPSPRKNESKDDFISRCMSDEVVKSDFPDRKQRFAVCSNLFEDKSERKMKDKE